MIQHTPDVKRTFECLCWVRAAGRVACRRCALQTPCRCYTIRATYYVPDQKIAVSSAFLVHGAVAVLLPLSIALKRVPLIGRYLYPLIGGQLLANAAFDESVSANGRNSTPLTFWVVGMTSRRRRRR